MTSLFWKLLLFSKEIIYIYITLPSCNGQVVPINGIRIIFGSMGKKFERKVNIKD